MSLTEPVWQPGGFEPDGDWRELVAETKSAPLLYGVLTSFETSEERGICWGPGEVVCGLGFLAFFCYFAVLWVVGFLAMSLPAELWWPSLIGPAFSAFVGLFVLIPSSRPLRLANSIRVNLVTQELRVDYGPKRTPKSLVRPLKSVRLELRHDTYKSNGQEYPHGVKLFLCSLKGDKDSQDICLAKSDFHETLSKLCASVFPANDTDFRDETLEEVILASGESVAVSTSPCATSNGFSLPELQSVCRGVFALTASIKDRLIFLGVFGLPGLFGLWMAAHFVFRIKKRLFVIGGLGLALPVGLLFSSLGILGMLYRYTIEFDVGSREIRFFRGILARKPKPTISFEDVALIQVLTHFVRDSDSSYVSYELNLVTRPDQTPRIALANCKNRDDTFACAHKLGDLLNVPVINHTEIGY